MNMQIPTTALIIAMLFAPMVALADAVNLNGSLFKKSKYAISGYDTVAYFTKDAPVKGDPKFHAEHNGATWLFATAEHRDLFTEDPQKYAPQYGGYCAYAVANGSTASIEPEQFTIHDGKLYLNYNARINTRWRAEKEDYIETADQQWPDILEDLQ